MDDGSLGHLHSILKLHWPCLEQSLRSKAVWGQIKGGGKGGRGVIGSNVMFGGGPKSVYNLSTHLIMGRFSMEK